MFRPLSVSVAYKREVKRRTESGDRNRWPICCQNSKGQRQVVSHWMVQEGEEASQSRSVSVHIPGKDPYNLDHLPRVDLINIINTVRETLLGLDLQYNPTRFLLVNWEVSMLSLPHGYSYSPLYWTDSVISVFRESIILLFHQYLCHIKDMKRLYCTMRDLEKKLWCLKSTFHSQVIIK